MDNQTLPQNQPLTNDTILPTEQVPTFSSEKPRNNLLFQIGLIAMFSVVFGLVGYYFGQKSLSSESDSVQNEQNGNTPVKAYSVSLTNTEVIPSPSSTSVEDKSGEFDYDSFSLPYPSDWRFMSRDDDENFPLKDRLTFDEKVVALEKNGIYLIVNISKADQMEAGGIFTNDAEFDEFTKDKDSLQIEDSTFYLMKSHPSISTLENSHSGSAGWGSLIQYVPNKMTTSGNIFKGYESIIKRNGNMFNFIVVGTTDGQTPNSIQNELKIILQSIRW